MLVNGVEAGCALCEGFGLAGGDISLVVVSLFCGPMNHPLV